MNQETRNRVAESVVAIAVLIAAWFVLAQPLHERASEASARVRSLEAELEPYRTTAAMTHDNSKAAHRRIEMLLDLAAPTATLADHERILSAARNNGLGIDRLNPGPDSIPSRVGPLLTASERFEIETVGPFASIAALLSDLANEAPMMVVDYFRIAPARSDVGADVTLTASIRVGRIWTQSTDVAEVHP